MFSNDHLIVPVESAPQRVARVLTFGFGATTVMWMLCYVAMLQPGQIIGEALFVMVILALLLAGVLAGSTAQSIAPTRIHPLSVS